VDRLIIKAGIRSRLADSLETTLKLSSGLALIVSNSLPVACSPPPLPSPLPAAGRHQGEGLGEGEMLLSEQFSCPQCGISYGEIVPRMFSFNSPYGACPTCDGLGTKMEIDPDLIIPDKRKSLSEGAIEAWRRGGRQLILYYRRMLRSLANHYDIDLYTPFEELDKRHRELVLYGSEGEEIELGRWRRGVYHRYRSEFEGVIPNLERRFRETESDYVRETILQFMSFLPCSSCKGARLKPESLAIKVGNKSIAEVTALSVGQAQDFFADLKLAGEKKRIAREIIKEIKERLGFLSNVGLDYLTLDRATGTLSSGEAERIRLATQIGSGLVGVLYILDEPSIGLHQRDNRRLLNTLIRLRDLGNTVLVVEHDEATIRLADFIIDLGPGAGNEGGQVVALGTLKDIINSPQSLTGQYLRGRLKIAIPEKRRLPTGKFLEVKGARENNLKSIDVKIPLGVFTCVTGVSGSGKSTLIEEILYKSLAQRLYRARMKPGEHDGIEGVENIDKVIVIDQAPIGRTPRSNPATYTGAFTFIRELFSRLPEARMRGYKPGRFSFNIKGGRCPACRGDGIIKIEMHFLPDVYVHCQGCKGKRYNEETLKVRYKGKNIAEVLDMVIEEALGFFKNIPRIKKILQTLYDVGLGYIKLGQSAPTLSGGEAQRVKLASELSRRGTGKTLYILDEPTTGLHFADIQRLLDVLSRLTEAGNSVLVIEHNLDVIKTADYIIDLGPEGGEEGGRIVAAGTPEEVARTPNSHTGYFLKKVL
ncbi:excinuclease ABC subunit UvrA, partial [candidate division NPL-UPA2 bacterium]|nr:excinuclease ABC subunit UvrA [candidate division NPL-UPA2 bacterium]